MRNAHGADVVAASVISLRSRGRRTDRRGQTV